MYLTANSPLIASNQRKTKKALLKMFTLSLIVASPIMLIGMDEAYSIVAVPQMRLNIADASWIVSAPAFAAPVGSILIGFVIDKYGRRAALLYGVMPYCIGWPIIYWMDTVHWILVGRTINGLGIGALIYAPQVYASECLLADYPRILASFRAWTAVFNELGITTVLFISLFLNYHQLGALMLVLSILEFVLIYTLIPESPNWLRYKGRHGDADMSHKLLGCSVPLLSEAIYKAVVEEKRSTWARIKSTLHMVKRKDVYKPLIVSCILFALSLESGAMAIQMYLVKVIGDENSNPISNDLQNSESYQYSVISGVLGLVAAVLLCFTLPNFGARKTILVSFTLMGLFLGVLAFTEIVNTPSLYMLHVVSVWIIVFLTNFGVLNLPGILLGHLFPFDAKGFASVVTVVYFLLAATSLKLHPYMELVFGGYLYYGYSAISFCSVTFVFLFIPETVGKTQSQITNAFVKGVLNGLGKV